jgi:hypothetical protein
MEGARTPSGITDPVARSIGREMWAGARINLRTFGIGAMGGRRNTNECPTWHTCQMAFRIDYFKGGLLTGSIPHPGPQHEAENFAKDGMIRHRADFYRIIDVGSNAEVASGRRDG